MIVVGVLGADADDATSLPIQRSCQIIRSSFELYFDFYIDALPVEISRTTRSCLPSKRMAR
jgi:hypothetical protein